MGRILIYALISLELAVLTYQINFSYLVARQKGNEIISLLNIPYNHGIKPFINEGTSTGKVITTAIVAGDARVPLLTQFIKQYQPNSPFLSHANFIVQMADKYNLDFRLTTAIAMCESNLGARLPKKDAHNAWGIAVFTPDIQGKRFDDWNHAIEWVSKYIKEKYYDRGITDLYDIGAIWAPPSVERNYSWTRCVEMFMDKIQ